MKIGHKSGEFLQKFSADVVGKSYYETAKKAISSAFPAIEGSFALDTMARAKSKRADNDDTLTQRMDR